MDMMVRRAELYAAKLIAEFGSGAADPSDALMRVTFRNCVRVPGSSEYPQIRVQVARMLPELRGVMG